MARFSVLLIAFVTLFASSIYGLSGAGERRGTNNPSLIQDGSFEQISTDYMYKTNFRAGAWKFSGRATLDHNVNCTGFNPDAGECTPYGKNFVAFFKSLPGTYTKISQYISGLSGSTYYQMHFSFKAPIVPKGGCNITFSLGGQLIDVYSIAAPYENEDEEWVNVGVSFYPLSVTEGNFDVSFRCAANVQRPVNSTIYLDQLSLKLGPPA